MGFEQEYQRWQSQENAIELNTLWLRLARIFMHEYDEVKKQNRLIDFDDMQWQAWQLIHQFGDNSAIQLKLNNRIQHILIDEFQDTSLLQWQIIEPFRL